MDEILSLLQKEGKLTNLLTEEQKNDIVDRYRKEQLALDKEAKIQTINQLQEEVRIIDQQLGG